jgi:hypothetical protein
MRIQRRDARYFVLVLVNSVRAYNRVCVFRGERMFKGEDYLLQLALVPFHTDIALAIIPLQTHTLTAL